MAKKTDETIADPVAAAPVVEAPPVEDVVALDAQIATLESDLAALRARKTVAAFPKYPKVRYHKTEKPIEVADAQAEADAAAKGYTYDGPQPQEVA